MFKRTGTFQAIGSDNETYTVDIFTNCIEAKTLTNPFAVVEEGIKELRTSDGLAIKKLAEGHYKVGQTGVFLHSDSPDAP